MELHQLQVDPSRKNNWATIRSRMSAFLFAFFEKPEYTYVLVGVFLQIYRLDHPWIVPLIFSVYYWRSTREDDSEDGDVLLVESLDNCDEIIIESCSRDKYSRAEDAVSRGNRTVNIASTSINRISLLQENYTLNRILDQLNIKRSQSDSWVEVGVGGCLMNSNLVKRSSSYCQSNARRQLQLTFKPPENRPREILGANIEDVHPEKVDLLLSVWGNTDSRDHSERVDESLRTLETMAKWLRLKPRAWVIKIPCIWSEEVIEQLETLRQILGSGRLLRDRHEVRSSGAAYFIHGNELQRRSLGDQALEFFSDALKKTNLGYDIAVAQMDTSFDKMWPGLGSSPVPRLSCPDMTASLKEVGLAELKELRELKFYVTLGTIKASEQRSEGTWRNKWVLYCISKLRRSIPDFYSWRTTSTQAADTYEMFKQKVDVAPVEDSKFFNRLWECFQGISDHIRTCEGGHLKFLSDTEIVEGLNSTGAMGFQEEKLKFKNIGEYVREGTLWTVRMRELERDLLAGKAKLMVFNSVGKKDKQQKKTSRLIQFLPATARLLEAKILADMDRILELLPYSVSGVPLYDYGDILASIFTKDKLAVCDDVKSWDTRVSLTVLSMECAFIKSLVPPGPNCHYHRRMIEKLYEVYCHPHVMVMRPKAGTNELEYAILRGRGQVASGRRVTYSMNTITNIALTLTRASVSQGVLFKDVRKWVAARCAEGHSMKYGGKISGDDSAIMMGKRQARAYAAAFHVMNNLGFPRKDIKEDCSSRLIWDMKSLEFCSHRYSPVCYGQEQKVFKWMPVRSADTLFAKTSIMARKPKKNDKCHQLAWARSQGVWLLVNYHHIPSVRKLGYMLLAVTPKNIDMTELDLGWKMKIQPWVKIFTSSSYIEIVQNCLFGPNSRSDKVCHIRDVDDLGYMSRRACKMHELGITDAKYSAWAEEAISIVEAGREEVKEIFPMAEFDYMYDSLLDESGLAYQIVIWILQQLMNISNYILLLFEFSARQIIGHFS